MNPQIQIVSIVGSLLVLGLVFQLIRRRRLREEYALLWIVAGLSLLGISLWRDLLHITAALVGIAYPPSLLLLAAIVLGVLLAIHFSISLSRLADQNKRLAQEVALLKQELERACLPARELTAPGRAESAPLVGGGRFVPLGDSAGDLGRRPTVAPAIEPVTFQRSDARQAT